MIFLDATNRSLEVDLDGAVTTNELDFVASYADISQTDFTLSGASTNTGTTNGTTAVTLVAAPGASTSRQLKYLSVRNTDTVSATVTVQFNDNATIRGIGKFDLAVDDSLVFTDAEGFFVLDSDGSKKYSSDRNSDIADVLRTDGLFLVGDGSDFVGETGSTARTSLGFTSPILDRTAPGAIGGTTEAAGTFDVLTATSSFTSPGIDDNANAIAITIDANENVLIGTTTPATGSPRLDVVGDLRALTISDSETNNNNKQAGISVRNFVNATQPVAMIIGQSLSATTSRLLLGGGSVLFNAVQQHDFYVGQGDTPTGTLTARISGTAITAPLDLKVGDQTSVGDTPGAPLHVADSGTVLGRLETTSASNIGSIFQFYQNSPSPADNDIPTVIHSRGNTDDGAGGVTTSDHLYGEIRGLILDSSDTDEEHTWFILNNVGGSNITTQQLGSGLVQRTAAGANPTGGMVAGAINAPEVRDDNSVLTCYPRDIQEAKELGIDVTDPEWQRQLLAKWDPRVPNRDIPEIRQEEPVRDEDGNEVFDEVDAGFDDEGNPKVRRVRRMQEVVKQEASVEVRQHDPLRKHLARLGTQYDPYTIEGAERHWKDKGHLSAYPNPDNYDVDRDGKGAIGLGALGQRGWEMDELLFIHILELHNRVKALEV